MRALALALGVALVGCGPDYPPVVWSGEHLEYATDLDRELCGGTFHLQDRFVEMLADLVGLSLSEPILFAYVDQSRIEEFCTVVESAGCARSDAVVSTHALSRHELTHAVTLAAGWRGPSPFVEGVAEMFNDGVDLDEVRVPLTEVLDDFQITGAHYFTMGLFVRFLVERHSLEALAAFMRDSEYEDPRTAYEAAFAEHFGESLSDAITAFDDYPTCPEWSNRNALVECGLPLEEWVDGALEISAELECNNPDVIGPLENDDMRIGSFAAFEISAEGSYSLQATSEIDGFSGVRVTRCGSCWDKVDEAVVAGESEVAELPAGRYYATFVADFAAPGSIDLRIEASP